MAPFALLSALGKGSPSLTKVNGHLSTNWWTSLDHLSCPSSASILACVQTVQCMSYMFTMNSQNTILGKHFILFLSSSRKPANDRPQQITNPFCICPLNWGCGGIKLPNFTLIPSVSSMGFSRHLCFYKTRRSHVVRARITQGNPGCQISCLACWWTQHMKPGHVRGFESAAQRVGYSEEGSEGI